MKVGALSLALSAFLFTVTAVGQNPQQSKDDLKRCIPKTVSHKVQNPHWHVRPGEKYVRMPVVSFEILASGNVSNVRVKRTSGVHDIDASAVEWVHSFKFNQRPGCPVVENEMGVNIEFTGG